MLSPDDQLLLTEALRPPAGLEVDCAIATTYSLTVESVLVAPMSFAVAHGDELPAESQHDTVGVLDAVQRYIDLTTVFVQSGGIHIPTSHSRILTFLEDSIVEVEPPNRSGSFHPKVWAVRYVAEGVDPHHRLIITSRNLTHDSSWDTILVLDESPDGPIDGGPAADFVRSLPGLATVPVDQGRARDVIGLADSLQNVGFAVPAPYSGGTLLPMGLDDAVWPFPRNAAKALVISPFLASGQLNEVRSGAEVATLISRADSMNALGRRALDGWDTRVLHAAAEGSDDDMDAADDPSAESRSDTSLHAKTVVLDDGEGTSLTVTGSANMTQSAWNRNVEFNATLRGPTRSTGVDAVLDGGEAPIGLRSITEPFTPENDEPETDAERAVLYRIEHFHRALARRQPVLDLTIQDDDTISVRLDLDVPDDDLSATTTVWLHTVTATARPLEAGGEWTIALVNVTRFLAVETTADVDGTDVARRCILTCAMSGDHIDRRRAALSAILSNPRSVLLYLAMLLGLDPNDAVLAADSQRSELEGASLVLTNGQAPVAGLPPIVLFEPLMHATREPAQLAKVARQIDELRSMPSAEERIPTEFLEMWDVVLATVRPGGTA